jgi:CHAT domain-containing protein
MNEQRQQSYLNLIQRLLNCRSNDEIQEILAANQELLDAGFLQAVEAAAQMFSQQGDENTASWLQGLASYLKEALNLDTKVDLPSLSEEEIQVYFQFLMDVLQATANSNGNAQVIYPLLAKNTDKLDGVLAEILRRWGTNTLREAEADKVEYLAAVIVAFSNLIQQFPLGNKASNMEIAIAGYEVALTVFTRERFPQDWAMTQNNLGATYSNRIAGEKRENLEQAIACYTQALEEPTRERFPQDWARTQNNLGNAYRDRIAGEKRENLEQAIACYTQALEERTRERFPYEWARTQNNLGNAYRDRIAGEKRENLEQAIACYTEALKVFLPQALPTECRKTARLLGNLYAKENRWTEATQPYQTALEAVEVLYEQSLTLTGKQEELAATGDLFHRTACALTRVGNLESAAVTLERGRARNLSETLARDRADLEQVQLLAFTYAPNALSLNNARDIARRISPNTMLAVDEPRPVSANLLPNSEREVQTAIETFPNHRVFRHEQATQPAVKNALANYSVLHFSCHGYANFNEPLDSGLLMANDERLSLRDLFDLRLTGIRLAVLSACETALPGIETIDEVVSLPIGILQAGVAGVAASLWSVADISTMMLMARFYDLWRKEGLELPEALRQAQQWVRDTTNGEKVVYFKTLLPEFSTSKMAAETADALYKQVIRKRPDARDFAHPFYWAAFTYTGV